MLPINQWMQGRRSHGLMPPSHVTWSPSATEQRTRPLFPLPARPLPSALVEPFVIFLILIANGECGEGGVLHK